MFKNLPSIRYLTIEGTIEKEDQLSMPYVWAQIEDLSNPSSPFSYYIPVKDRKFSQQVKLFAGKGDYQVTLRVPSPDNSEKFYKL